MSVITYSKPTVKPLSKQHDRTNFDCGVESLNRYLREQAGQDLKNKIAAPFVLIGAAASEIAGYYTLSSTSINIEDLPEKIAKKLPKYPLMPATLIGRLAIDTRHQGKGYGEFLLVDALKRALISTEQIGSVAVLVDAKDAKAKAFYQHFQFIPFFNYPCRLFLPMKIIQNYWKT